MLTILYGPSLLTPQNISDFVRASVSKEQWANLK
jgi:hypothetical protein